MTQVRGGEWICLRVWMMGLEEREDNEKKDRTCMKS